ncbi:MazG nucleotide pyrophosphohydrolase domain-containing protein [Microbacterium sp. NPDC055910]|uniref:MazG nucleotide pyrophosphohydrolase domain-containing protein n=1 Tax=Microbacterium sp. NPDC055910 TaxID=3345659 RepID=UPI0035DC0590
MTDAAPDPRAQPDALRAAAETMRAVRDRCVWTQQIDHRDLVPYLVEESAEVIDAVEDGTPAELREELGDLLWQVLFHAEIASRDAVEPFDIDDVARGLTDKMVRRHPHVFADAVARTSDEVLMHWNAAKAAEKNERTSVLDGVSDRMPSLALAQKLLGKATTLRHAQRPDPAAPPVPDPGLPPVPERAEGSTAEAPGLPPVPELAEGPTTEAELGDALLGLVVAARANGWDAERALRVRVRRLERDIRDAERA